MTVWNLNITPLIHRNMVSVSNIHILAAAFLTGLAAAAPIGPVNMMAIRRGVVGGWRHTFACAIGSIFGDLALFSLALFGGHYTTIRLTGWCAIAYHSKESFLRGRPKSTTSHRT
jgi:threonine/homoserine/homoserine lactone efflux protein